MRGFIYVLLFCCVANADTYTATSASQAHVEEKIALATSGDTVSIPAGTATWSSVISLPTGVVLSGSGVGTTTITTTVGQNGLSLTGADCIVEGISFVQAASTTTANAIILTNSTQDFIIRNCTFSNVSGRGIWFGTSSSFAPPKGLVHNCTFTAQSYGSPSSGTFQLLSVFGGENNFPPTENSNAGSLKFDPGFGSENAVFVEDCVFSQDAVGDSTIETYLGGKIVVRYCTATNFMLGIHGKDSSLRSGHIIEIYNNTFTNPIASSHFGTVLSRGGSGVVWGNTVSGNSSANKIVLQNYRAAGRDAISQPDYLLRYPYDGGQLDGSYRYDGNTPYHLTTGTGSHDGGDNQSTLTDSSQSWGTDLYLGDGGTSATDDNLQTYYVWNRTDGSGGFATGNTATTFTVTLSGGTDNDWDDGDVYVITNGYPGLDQNGWTGPTVFNGTYATQQLNPWYQWDNTFDGSAVGALQFSQSYTGSEYTGISQPDYSVFVQENREFYNDTARPEYTPYTYPHPLRSIIKRPRTPSAARRSALLTR